MSGWLTATICCDALVVSVFYDGLVQSYVVLVYSMPVLRLRSWTRKRRSNRNLAKKGSVCIRRLAI
ncbi:hypothetical protein FA95DRAFT_1555875 [Auriscalpium vulgare]|uniref:Uncharacterized protein n=1 Tax=Auriscalpium vulgare TaxID=40419 RepID=A0ACB8S252_9AGAM|nr:hypothetical protein FA95DRAFT_1555875 [Auriscalpium vulgare]